MNDLRILRYALLAALLAGCTSAPSHQSVADREIAAVSSLKRQYAGIVMGFDVRPADTLIVSLDLQQYIETDDQTIAAMKRDTLARWRSAWIGEHPHEHGTIHVRFIDFIGRKVATESTTV
jgi:hypothetical protein